MSDDIVATLRLWAKNANEQGVTNAVDGLQAAADEIERLRALLRGPDELVARLRELEKDLLKDDDLNDVYYIPLIGEAADEIERLRDTISRLEEQR